MHFRLLLLDPLEITLQNDIITIHKPYEQKLSFKIVDEEPIFEGTEAISLDDQTIAEMFWLSKVMGDYNISKIGENLLFTNGKRSMLLQRVS